MVSQINTQTCLLATPTTMSVCLTEKTNVSLPTETLLQIPWYKINIEILKPVGLSLVHVHV